MGLALNLWLTVLLGHSLASGSFTLKMKAYKTWNDGFGCVIFFNMMNVIM